MNNLIASGKRYRVILADCLKAMTGMEENSVDAVVCDPPYGLSFMGKSWDHGIPGIPFWQEALRVAKPGAYLLAFGGTRTFHRLACAIEDAGWVLRDTLSWNYGSGFPKSHDISKGIDRRAGAEREVVGKAESWNRPDSAAGDTARMNASPGEYKLTAPATPEAKQWDGWGTALKPAWEPVILAQAPLEGTYAENVLKWGCGALNIDGCRIGTDRNREREYDKEAASGHTGSGKPASNVPFVGAERKDGWLKQGRWPANFLLSHTIFCEKVGERDGGGYAINRFTDGAKPFGGGAGHPYESEKQGGQMVDVYRCVPDCPVAILDGQSRVMGMHGAGHVRSGSNDPRHTSAKIWQGPPIQDTGKMHRFGDQGGASRFFYCAKASSGERNAGLEEVHTLFERREAAEDKIQHRVNPGGLENDPRWGPKVSKNNHPTVKPIAILRYLCRLVTPPGGLVLDPFAGSGSTGCAAVQEGFQFVGIEKEREYAEIAEARIAHFSPMP